MLPRRETPKDVERQLRQLYGSYMTAAQIYAHFRVRKTPKRLRGIGYTSTPGSSRRRYHIKDAVLWWWENDCQGYEDEI